MKAHEFDKAMEEILAGRKAFEELREVEPTQANLFKLSGHIEFHQPERVRAEKTIGLERKGVEVYFPKELWHPSVFLQHNGMASRFDGTGMLVCGGLLFSFALCEHDWDESGANHSRGWHPKRCKKCGFDASIDSGD